MLLSARIQEAEKHSLALQDQLDKHLEGIDDTAPTEEQMVLTEDLTAKIETANRHLNNLKAIETKNAAGASDARELARTGGDQGSGRSRNAQQKKARSDRSVCSLDGRAR